MTSLFAALNVATGQVIGKCHRRHRHQEFLKFLDHIDGNLTKEPGVRIHIVLDNYATHKTPAVKRSFLRHPEYHLHFIPTGSSWLNQVERFFAEITETRIRRGAFESVRALEKAIAEYLAQHHLDPKPFRRVADADAILERIQKVCDRTSDSGHWRSTSQLRLRAELLGGDMPYLLQLRRQRCPVVLAQHQPAALVGLIERGVRVADGGDNRIGHTAFVRRHDQVFAGRQP